MLIVNSQSKGKCHNEGSSCSSSVKKTSFNFNIHTDAIKAKKITIRYTDQITLALNRLGVASKKESHVNIIPQNSNTFRKKDMMMKAKKFKTSEPSPEQSSIVTMNERHQNENDNANNIFSDHAENTLILIKKKLLKKTEPRHKSNFLNFTNPGSTPSQIPYKPSLAQKHGTTQTSVSPCIVSLNNSNVKHSSTKHDCQITEEKEKHAISPNLQLKTSSGRRYDLYKGSNDFTFTCTEGKNSELQQYVKKIPFISPSFTNNYVNTIMSKITNSTESKIVFKKLKSSASSSTGKYANNIQKAKMTVSTTPVTSKNSRTNSKEKKTNENNKNNKIKLHNTFNIQAILSKQARISSVVNSNYVSHQSNGSNTNNSSAIFENKFLLMNAKPKPKPRPKAKVVVSSIIALGKEKINTNQVILTSMRGNSKKHVVPVISNSQSIVLQSQDNINILPQIKSHCIHVPVDNSVIVTPGNAGQINLLSSGESEKSLFSPRFIMRGNNTFLKEAERITNEIKKFLAQNSEYPPTSTNFYKIGRNIGHGAFGKVNIGLHILSGRLVAIKSFNKSSPKFSKNKILHEISLMKKLRHHSVVQIYETLETEKYLLMVIEYVGGGDLLSFIKKRIKLNEITAKFLFRQIIEALQYVHCQNIVHRDIKLDNILIDLNGNIKICDFGVGKHVKKGVIMTEQCGTPAYIAPEILANEGYHGFSVDIWSAGVVLYAMLSGTVPFKGINESELHKLIIEGKYSPIPDISSEVGDLFGKILETDPKKRIHISDILSHPWLNNPDDSHMVKAKSKMTLFTNAEKILLSKSNIDYLTARQEDIVEMFTMKNLDTLQESENQNIGTQSKILAPFNSSLIHHIHLSLDMHLMIDNNNNLLKFCGNVKELNRNYELNYNGEIDHGKLIQNQKSKSFHMSAAVNHEKSDEDKDKDKDKDDQLLRSNSRSKVVSRKYSQPTSPPDVLVNDGKQGMSGIKEDSCHRNARKSMKEMLSTNANTLFFEDKVIKVLEGIGYKREYVLRSLSNGELNHATATYYLVLNATSEI